jgi:hypothetical protein
MIPYPDGIRNLVGDFRQQIGSWPGADKLLSPIPSVFATIAGLRGLRTFRRALKPIFAARATARGDQ